MRPNNSSILLSLLFFMMTFCATDIGEAQEQADLNSSERPDVLIISKDVQLDPQRTYGRIEIRASNITVDGRGAWLIGARGGARASSLGPPFWPKTFRM